MGLSKKTMRCPACHGPSAWEENPFKPFCSERCRMIDLGNWLGGNYKIPGERQDLSDEDVSSLEKEPKSNTIH